MRLFSLILSALTLVVTAFSLFTSFPDLNSIENLIYVCLMLLLLAISALGILLNFPEISRVHHRYRVS